jgi:putative membrane protein
MRKCGAREHIVAAGYNGVIMNPTQLKISRRIAAAALSASLASFLMGQPAPTPTLSPDQPPADANGGLSHHDHAFIMKAAKAGNKEIAVSQAVMDKLTNPQVKNFAQTMVTDHTAAGAELATIAASKNVQLPPADTSISDEWSKKSGDVDHKYVKEMVSDHEEAVKLFEKETTSKDPDLAAFAQKTLPTLQHHLMMAQDLAKALD